MLQLLLDEQINPEIVATAKKYCHQISIVALRDWMDGHFIGAPDLEVLREAARWKRTLVSYDLRTIPGILRSWGEAGINHGGVIFVDGKTLRQNDVSGIAKALVELWKLQKDDDWDNRFFFLQCPPNK